MSIFVIETDGRIYAGMQIGEYNTQGTSFDITDRLKELGYEKIIYRKPPKYKACIKEIWG